MSNMAGGGGIGSPGRTNSSDTARAVKDTVRDTTRQVAGAAKDQARSAYDQKKSVVFDEVGNLASALRTAGNQLRSQNDDSIAAKMTDRVAERLESVTSQLGNKDLDGIVRDVEDFGRSNPAVFLGIAAALGFAAIRFAKSSARSSMNDEWMPGSGKTDFESNRTPFIQNAEDV